MSNFQPPPTSSAPPPSLLCEITRAAKVSWCPSPQHPTLLAAGSTGTIDDSFETRSSLELYELSLQTSAAPSPPLLLGALTTKDYFYSVAWGMKGINAEFSHGLIAGGMSDGAVNIWNAGAIINKAPASSPPTPSTASAPSSSTPSPALLSRSTQQHSGAVKSLQFHPTQPNLLASGGNDGIVLVWDLQDVRQPRASKPNPALAGHEQQPITCLGWNKKVPQVSAQPRTARSSRRSGLTLQFGRDSCLLVLVVCPSCRSSRRPVTRGRRRCGI
jgi:protein transport protein SEC31